MGLEFSVRTIKMKLLVGRFFLGCISAVLVLADVASEKPIESLSESSPVTNQKISVDAVTEKLIKSSHNLTARTTLSESNPDKHSKIFSSLSSKGNVEREIVVIHDQSEGTGHHDHGNHDHHGYHDHHHEHDYHHSPPPRPPPHYHHDHHHPPPLHHHYPNPYPGYYPPHYPPYSHVMSQPYAVAAGAAIPPPYSYYPPSTYYAPPMKPTATIIQSSTTSSSTGQNHPKPTDLLNQGTEYLWNLFGKLGAVTSENHEVVVINPKPVHSTTSVQMLPPSWYSNKGKIISNVDCNSKKE